MSKQLSKCRLFFFIVLLTAPLASTAFGHEKTLARATLKKLFPDAENFVSRKVPLKPEQIRTVEERSQDPLHKADHQVVFWVALKKDASDGRFKSIGAALMVDAKGPKGLIDLVVAYDPDGLVKKVLVARNQDDPKLESPSFLQQLETKGPDSGWDSEKDFQFEGNPQSAQAFVKAVRRGMYLLLTAMERI